uniref:Uncharacterized protein n=1 Tax=Alexandrium catenella TaxID=2925 RepID=A0A7S1R3V4_ALECA|mmetsp:Transcript_44308/g.119546  ORF Transcript_44308/g.119546 Transcript_44308/m.119546 type:complete len:165 (+) Transcript_44308:1-495(+)
MGSPAEVDTFCDLADFGQPFAVGEPEMLCDAADFGQPWPAFPLGMPTPPGLHWLEDCVNTMVEAERAVGTWSHWPGGYDIAPNMMADSHVFGGDMSQRPSSDLDRLHEDIVSFQQKLQMLEQASSKVGLPVAYFKPGSGSDLDLTSEGSTAGGFDPQFPMYWGA